MISTIRETNPPPEPWRVGIKRPLPALRGGSCSSGFSDDRAPLQLSAASTTHLPTRPMARPFLSSALHACRRCCSPSGRKSPSSHRFGSMPSSRYRSSFAKLHSALAAAEGLARRKPVPSQGGRGKMGQAGGVARPSVEVGAPTASSGRHPSSISPPPSPCAISCARRTAGRRLRRSWSGGRSCFFPPCCHGSARASALAERALLGEQPADHLHLAALAIEIIGDRIAQAGMRDVMGGVGW